MKHTTGNWKAQGQLVTVNDKNIAFCGYDNKDEAEANAKLIAAAPKLLENIKRIIDRIEENNLQSSFTSAYERAKEAINAATTQP